MTIEGDFDADVLEKMNRYTDLSARMMFDEGRRCRFPDLPLRPLLAFLKSYVLRAGFLDGIEGLMLSKELREKLLVKNARKVFG